MTDLPCKIDLVVGTRPNIVKAGPLLHALATQTWCRPRMVFLRQHQDERLSEEIIEDLRIDQGLIHREDIESSDLGLRFGEMVSCYQTLLRQAPPSLVIVFGDVDATLAGTIAAKRLQLPVAHVEAGLRSGDRTMPEELNRLMVDAIADIHFATSEDAMDTLIRKEGHNPGHVHFVGNLMIDALLRTSDAAHGQALCAKFGVEPGAFILATFHRPSNVDAVENLHELLTLLRNAAQRLPVLLPLHPRTSAALRKHRLQSLAEDIPGLTLLPPLRYRDFVSLLPQSRVVLTDSGGIQEETSVLGIPCITVRGNTERPITLALGSNRLASPADAVAALDETLETRALKRAQIPGWDGAAAARIARHLEVRIAPATT